MAQTCTDAMELEKVVSRECLRKRDRPDPEVESTTIDGCQLRHERLWEDLMKGLGLRPIRQDSEHMEEKTSWLKMDLSAERRAAAEAAAADSSTDDEDDEPGEDLRRFRKRWNDSWSGANSHGDFEDTTLIPPMRYTDGSLGDSLYLCDTLEIFWAKVSGIGEGLQWPLDVFGIVAIRDTIDENRNIIFQRSSLNCQTLTEKDANLVLTGPTRSVVLSDSVFIEVDLKVKGKSEDKTLFCRVLSFRSSGDHYSRLVQLKEKSKFSTLEFTLGHICFSLAATIFVRVIDGLWPDVFHGEFAACTISTDGKGSVVSDTTSVNHKEIVLHGFGPGKGPVAGDGNIELSRRVVCVKSNSKLEVFVKAWQGDDCIVVDKAVFTAKESGRSYGKLEVASCIMEVTVAWSFVTRFPEVREETILKNKRCNL